MIAIIIINWNGHEDTIACLESLARIKRLDFRVYLIDNASEPSSLQHIIDWCDGSVHVSTAHPAWSHVLKERTHLTSWKFFDEVEPDDRPFLTIIKNKENSGYAAANNIGISLTLSQKETKYFWLLNNDTIVASDCLDAMCDRMQDNEALGVLGATVLYYDTPTTVQALGGAYFSPKWGYGDHIGRGLPLAKIPERQFVEKQLTYILGASMFVSRSFIETVGPMTETYFLFMEEIDWTERNRGRFNIGWEPKAYVFHKEGKSTGSSQRARPSATSIYYQAVNLLRFNQRYHPTYIPITFLRLAARATKYLIKKDTRSSYVVFIAIFDFLIGRRRTGPIKA